MDINNHCNLCKKPIQNNTNYQKSFTCEKCFNKICVRIEVHKDIIHKTIKKLKSTSDFETCCECFNNLANNYRENLKWNSYIHEDFKRSDFHTQEEIERLLLEKSEHFCLELLDGKKNLKSNNHIILRLSNFMDYFGQFGDLFYIKDNVNNYRLMMDKLKTSLAIWQI